MKPAYYLLGALLQASSWGAVLAPMEGASPLLDEAHLLQFRAALNDKALAALRSASHLEGHNEIVDMQSLANRLFLLAENHMSPQAVRAARLLVQLAPDSGEAHRLLGHLLYRSGQHADALSALDTAVKEEPSDIGAWVLRGYILAEQEKLPEALAQFEEALKLLPSHAELLHNAGVVLHRMGRHKEAITALTRACELNPSSANSLHDLALALAAVGRHAEAVRSFEGALALSPDSPTIRRNLASAYFDAGQPAHSIPLLASVLVEDDDPDVWTDLITAMRSWVGDAEALEEATPEQVESLHQRALQHLHENRTDESLRDLVHAFALMPERPGPANDLGALLSQLNQPEAALILLMRAASQSPAEGSAGQNIEVVQRKLQNRNALQEAVRHWTNVMKNPAKAYEACLTLGALHQALGNADAARDHLRQAARLQPKQAEPLRSLAALEESLNRLASAEAVYRESLAIQSDDAETLLRLAWVLLRLPANTAAFKEALSMAVQAHQPPHPTTPASLQILSAAQAMNGLYREAENTALRGATMAEVRGDVALTRTLNADREAYAQFGDKLTP